MRALDIQSNAGILERMDGDTPINCYQPQFTQREASVLAGVEMTAINNWIARDEFALSESTERLLRGRRLFSVADVAALHVMHFCTKMLDMRPAAAAFAGRVVHEFYRSPDRPGATPEFEVWHIVKKNTMPSHPIEDPGDGAWTAQAIWQQRGTGAFFHYDPALFGVDDPFGFPHFPCISIPTSHMAHRIFLQCADLLMQDEGTQPASAQDPSG